MGMSVLGATWSSINMSLAAIQEDLGANILELGWMMNLYGIAICITLLPIGKLGDYWGKKRFYMLGLIGLILACLGAGTANSISTVIAFMGLLGVSGASILALSQALMVHAYPENQKHRAIALWGSFTSIALSIGPLLGGAIVKYLSWRWVFFINIPLALVSLILVLLFVKQKESHSSDCKWGGIGLLALLIGGLVIAIMHGPLWGWCSWKVLSLLSLSIISLLAFVAVEKRSEDPLFHPNLFAHKGFLLASICNGFLIGFVWAIFFFVPLYLQNQKGLSSLQAGFNMLLITLPITLLSFPVSHLYKKSGAKPLLVSGFFLLFLAVFFHSRLSTEIFCLIIGFGWVLTWGPSTTKALSSLPHRVAGIASGMFMSLQEIGGVLGLTISSVVFRVGMKHFLAPQMKEIQSVLQDQTDYLLSDPIAVAKLVEPNSPIIDWLHQGFKIGYDHMLLFLSFFMILALIAALLIPKEKHQKSL
jgi:EmrB/QacA subfamily drug resistance transporter